MAQNTRSGGRTLIDGTEYEIGFGPDGYVMTIIDTSSSSYNGATITYNGVRKTETFVVAIGDSIMLSANASAMGRKTVNAYIYLNNRAVAQKTADPNGESDVYATYTYTPNSNATIETQTIQNVAGFATTISITEE